MTGPIHVSEVCEPHRIRILNDPGSHWLCASLDEWSISQVSEAFIDKPWAGAVIFPDGSAVFRE